MASVADTVNVDEDSAVLHVCERRRINRSFVQINFPPFRKCNKCKHPIMHLDDTILIPCNQCTHGYKTFNMSVACHRVRIMHHDSEGKATLDRTPMAVINKLVKERTIEKRRWNDDDECNFTTMERLPTRLTRELPQSQQESANIFCYCPASSTPPPPKEVYM